MAALRPPSMEASWRLSGDPQVRQQLIIHQEFGAVRQIRDHVVNLHRGGAACARLHLWVCDLHRGGQ